MSCSASVSISPRYRAKVVGNGLRELDRFLSVLLDELAIVASWSGPEIRALARLRHTADKLVRVCGQQAVADEDMARLRALAHCRNILFHCDGVVRRGDARHGARLTLGWPSDAGDGRRAMILQIGDRVAVSETELLWICAFYSRIGNELVRNAPTLLSGKKYAI